MADYNAQDAISQRQAINIIQGELEQRMVKMIENVTPFARELVERYVDNHMDAFWKQMEIEIPSRILKLYGSRIEALAEEWLTLLRKQSGLPKE